MGFEFLQSSRLGRTGAKTGDPRNRNRRPPVHESKLASKYSDVKRQINLHFQARALAIWGTDFRVTTEYRADNLELIIDSAKSFMDENSFLEFMRDINEGRSAVQGHCKMRCAAFFMGVQESSFSVKLCKDMAELEFVKLCIDLSIRMYIYEFF